jgi:uncharacterized protein (DUF885 family)
MRSVAEDPEREGATKLRRLMRRSRRVGTRARSHGVVALALLLALGTGACNPRAPSASDETSASAQLSALVDEAWDRQIEHSPFARIREGLPVSELPPFSYDSAETDAIYAQSLLDRLDAIDTAQLEHEDVLTAEILRWQASMQVEGLQYYWLQSLLTPYVNPLPGLQRIFAAQPLNDLQDLDAYLRLAEQVSPYVRSLYETVRSQAARGFVISRANMPAVIAVTRAAIRPAANHPLAPSGDKLSAFATEDAQAFEIELGDIIEREINPAIEELAEYLEGEYLALAPEGVGVRQYPDGDSYYRYLARLTTTMDVTPEEVQQVGFDMVQQMQQEMAAIQTEIGFDGTAADFRRHLRDDPSFYPQTPDEVGERLLRAADRFYERIGDYFLVVPEAPYGVRRLDPALEGSQTYGYYSPPTPADPEGYYNYNGSDLDQRSWLNLEGVAFHELIPGHHFHIARQYENESLPPMRRYTLPTAFTEGWGSYASYLGLEAGMYDDAYSRYGMYILEIFLATRLVVDPGMNYFGWSLEQARDFMRESTFESETQIATESLRYSTDMPAQALAYQMGKRKILELRAQAETELGDAFDLRRFHEAILGSGAMPMTVLEQHIDWWIEQERATAR